MLIDYFPVLFQIIVAVGFAGVSLALSVVLGQSGHRTKAKDTAYECGKDPIGPTTARFSVKFYMVAMLFILFDIETVFFFLWAIVYKHMVIEEGLEVLYAMLFFVTILLVGLVYELKKRPWIGCINLSRRSRYQGRKRGILLWFHKHPIGMHRRTEKHRT